MKKNNILLLVSNDELISVLRSNKNITFLFPLKNFTVGFTNTYMLEDIKEANSYIFINRILDEKAIKEFKKLLDYLPSNIKGIVFDDIGVLNILIQKKVKLTKILFLNHLNCNYESINTWLEYVESVVPSTDITNEELKVILNKTSKPLVVFTFGHVNIMYSRRNLITSYNNNFNKLAPLNSVLTEKITKEKFKIVENNYGTVIYTNKPFNNLDTRSYSNILYNLINTVYLTNEEVLNIVNDNYDKRVYTYKYLSEKETYFKIKDGKND